MKNRIQAIAVGLVLLLAVTVALTVRSTARSHAQEPDWHCCVYTCYNPNSPSQTHQTYFCHPTADCPSLPGQGDSAEVCILNGPGVEANSCADCVNNNY